MITPPNQEFFTFESIYMQWIDFNNEVVNSCSIITTQANELMSEILNLNTKQWMQIILKSQDEENWLIGENHKDFAFSYSSNLIATSLENNFG